MWYFIEWICVSSLKIEWTSRMMLTMKALRYRVEAVQMTFVIIGASMGAIGFMILAVGCLATGATRYKVYKAWRSRVGGRISCAVVSERVTITQLIFLFVWKYLKVHFQFMAITYFLQIAWILMFCFLTIITFIFTIFWSMCANPRVENLMDCIDFTQFCKRHVNWSSIFKCNGVFFRLFVPTRNFARENEDLQWSRSEDVL